jgi:selenophosphate synthetase-related protein
LRWLTAFPSFGFLLAVAPEHANTVCARFDALGVAASAVGEVTDSRYLELCHGPESEIYWDLRQRSLTGFAA